MIVLKGLDQTGANIFLLKLVFFKHRFLSLFLFLLSLYFPLLLSLSLKETKKQMQFFFIFIFFYFFFKNIESPFYILRNNTGDATRVCCFYLRPSF